MDLLNAAMHELGHVFGLEHAEYNVMADTLVAGYRKLYFRSINHHEYVEYTSH